MHTIAGAILVLAGAVLFAAGVVVEATMKYWSPYEAAYYLGAAVGIAGIVMMSSKWIKKKWDDIPIHQGTKSDDDSTK